MELRVLKYFLTVAREENITRASEILHITQPTLSRQLMQLEEELGAALFIRGKRKIVLTEDGMILKRRAEEILQLTNKAEMEIGHHNEEVSGEIYIGCGITEATQVIAQLMKKFSQLYPQVTFHMSNGNTDFILEKIDNGILDIGVVMEPVSVDKLNFIQLKHKERWGVIMKKDSHLANKETIVTEDLKGLPIINSLRRETQNHFTRWLGKATDDIHVSATSELSTTASILVKNDFGYAIVVEGSVKDTLGDDLCFKPLEPELTAHSFIVWKKYQSYSYTVSKFIDFMYKELHV